MNTIPMPALAGVQSVDWRLERNSAVFESPLSRAAQRIERSGDRWRCTLQFPPALLSSVEAGVLMAWLDQISSPLNYAYLSPPHNQFVGTWWGTYGETLTNGAFLSDVTSWSGTSATLAFNARRMKVKNSGAASGSARQNVTLNFGKNVLIVDAYRAGITAVKAKIARQSDDAVEADSGAITAPSRIVLAVTPTVQPMRVELYVDSAVSADSVMFGGASLTRCLAVDGASQTGNRLTFDSGLNSQTGMLRAGQFFSVKQGSFYGLHRLVEDVDTDSGGSGVLVFEPALRASPADNDPIILRNPFSRFRVAETMSAQAIRAPMFQGVAVDLVEDVTP